MALRATLICLWLPAVALYGADSKAVKFRVTAYCSCSKCCGKWADGITATGTKARWGMVAADWKVIPKHSRIRIEGLKGTFVVEDKGGAIKGRRIDVWFPSHKAARKFGVSTRRVTILPPKRRLASSARSRNKGIL